MSNPLEKVFFTSEIQNKIPEMIAMLPLQEFLPPRFLQIKSSLNKDPYCKQVQYFCLEESELWGQSPYDDIINNLERSFPYRVKIGQQERKEFQKILILLQTKREDAVVEVHSFGIVDNSAMRTNDWRSLIQIEKQRKLVDCLLTQSVLCQFTGISIQSILASPLRLEVKAMLTVNLHQISIKFDEKMFPSTPEQVGKQLNEAILGYSIDKNWLSFSKGKSLDDLNMYVESLEWEDKAKMVFKLAQELNLVVYQKNFRIFKRQVYIDRICQLINEAMTKRQQILLDSHILDILKLIIEEDSEQEIIQLFKRLYMNLA